MADRGPVAAFRAALRRVLKGDTALLEVLQDIDGRVAEVMVDEWPRAASPKPTDAPIVTFAETEFALADNYGKEDALALMVDQVLHVIGKGATPDDVLATQNAGMEALVAWELTSALLRGVRASTAVRADTASEWYLSGDRESWDGARTLTLGGVADSEHERLAALPKAPYSSDNPPPSMRLFHDEANWGEYTLTGDVVFSGDAPDRVATLDLAHVASQGVQGDRELQLWIDDGDDYGYEFVPPGGSLIADEESGMLDQPAAPQDATWVASLTLRCCVRRSRLQ